MSKNGEQQFLVLRGSTLRVFSAETKKRKIGLPDVILRLDYAEVEALTGQRFEVRTQTPSKASHVFQAKSEEKTREWVMNLSQHIAETKTRFDQYIQILTEGGTAYKYNYSNSKRMRRHFWVDLQKVELCWSKAKSEGEEPQMMSLRDSVGLIYGPMTTTFQRCESLEDLPWTCFSILFSDRTLDMAVPSQMESWFLGLQFYLIGRSNCVSCITEAQFVFRRVYHKLSTSAHKHGYTTWVYLISRVKALGQDAAFREALDQAHAGGDFTYQAKCDVDPTTEALDAKAERRAARAERQKLRQKKDSVTSGEKRESAEGQLLFAPPTRDSVSASPSASSPGASPGASSAAKSVVLTLQEAEEQDLQSIIGDMEKQLAAASARVEAVKGEWPRVAKESPWPDLCEVINGDSAAWQHETCGEIERELLQLQMNNKCMTRQIQAAEKVEKQLYKLGKQYKKVLEQVQNMEQELGSAQVRANSTETARQTECAEQQCSEAQTSHLERRVKELQEQLQQASKPVDEMALLKQQNETQMKELAKLDVEKAELEKKLKALEVEHQKAQERCSSTEGKIQTTSNTSRRLVQFLQKLKEDVSQMQAAHRQLREEPLNALMDVFPPLTGAVQKMCQGMSNMLDRYQEVAQEKKKLHNMVLELKGNIRVFVRVRPMGDKEKAAETAGEVTITFAEEGKVSVYDTNQQRRKWFDFDKAFQPNSTQQEVFEEVKPLATSVLDGYNVCIFAYGQTGSGKTFTMTGSDANPGLNTRVLRELFQIRDHRKEEVEISISLSVSEIYNEMIKDLFNPDSAKTKKLDVKQNSDGTNSVPGLTERQVNSVEEVLKYMKEAQSNRTVMATDMNDESSRSHSIVQVKTTNVNRKDKTQYLGKINLIDLAGSENVNKSGVQGQGMREAQNINKSLLALGDVVASLQSKSGHVSYRNSKLTMMLKDSLGGDSKTMMIVQCSPAQSNVTETASSLTFASKARNVELGKATRNVKAGEAG